LGKGPGTEPSCRRKKTAIDLVASKKRECDGREESEQKQTLKLPKEEEGKRGENGEFGGGKNLYSVDPDPEGYDRPPP